MSVAEAQQKVSSKEFVDWMAYELIEPSEPKRSDIQAALICTIIANAHRAKGKAFTIEDFLLEFGKEEKETRRFPTAKELKLKMQSWLMSQRLMGGELKK